MLSFLFVKSPPSPPLPLYPPPKTHTHHPNSPFLSSLLSIPFNPQKPLYPPFPPPSIKSSFKSNPAIKRPPTCVENMLLFPLSIHQFVLVMNYSIIENFMRFVFPPFSHPTQQQPPNNPQSKNKARRHIPFP